MAMAVLAVIFGGLAAWGWLWPRESAAVSRFPLVLKGVYAEAFHTVAVSPDGAHIAYGADSVGGLFVRDRDRLEASRIPDGETGDTPFFSPDGEQVAFCTGTPGALRVASLTGGAGRVLVRDSAYASGGTWSNDGWIYFVGGATQALLRVRAEGGKPELVARPDTAHDELFFDRPQILPGDRTALVTIWRRKGPTDIAAVDIGTGKTTVLTRGVEALYARSGHESGAWLPTPCTCIKRPWTRVRNALNG